LDIERTPFLIKNENVLQNLTRFGANLIAKGNYLYAVSAQGTLHVLDLRGKVLGKLDLTEGRSTKILTVTSPVIAEYDNNIYIGTNKGIYVASIQDPQNPKYQNFWGTPGNLNKVTSGLLVERARLYFGCEDGKLYCFSIGQNGIQDKSEKSYDTKGLKIYATPSYYNFSDKEYILYACTKTLFCLDQDFKLLWKFETPVHDSDGGEISSGSDFRASPLAIPIPDTIIGRVFAVDIDGDYYCLSLKDGKELWRHNMNTDAGKGCWGTPALVNTTVYMASKNGKIIAKNLLDPSKDAHNNLFEYVNPHDFEAPPFYIKDAKMVLFLDIRGQIIAFTP
jgi:outer membrane protein assembly factor BamB